jgi:hypothetical protein
VIRGPTEPAAPASWEFKEPEPEKLAWHDYGKGVLIFCALILKGMVGVFIVVIGFLGFTGLLGPIIGLLIPAPHINNDMFSISVVLNGFAVVFAATYVMIVFPHYLREDSTRERRWYPD